VTARISINITIATVLVDQAVPGDVSVAHCLVLPLEPLSQAHRTVFEESMENCCNNLEGPATPNECQSNRT